MSRLDKRTSMHRRFTGPALVVLMLAGCVAGLAVAVLMLAGPAMASETPTNTFQTLNGDLKLTTATTARQKQALAYARKILAKAPVDLKTDISKAKQLENLLGTAFVDNIRINDDLGAILDELEGGTEAQRAALAQRAAAYRVANAKAKAEACAVAASAHLAKVHGAATRMKKANLIGLALQDVLMGETYLRDDVYFYAVVDGEAVLITKGQEAPHEEPSAYADGRGGYFSIMANGPWDNGILSLRDRVTISIAGLPKVRKYMLKGDMSSHSRIDISGTAPDGIRDVMKKGGYVKFLKVDAKRHIVSGVFEFSVGLRGGDKTQVDHVNYGSFRVHYIL
jgi:hypothetical protein